MGRIGEKQRIGREGETWGAKELVMSLDAGIVGLHRFDQMPLTGSSRSHPRAVHTVDTVDVRFAHLQCQERRGYVQGSLKLSAIYRCIDFPFVFLGELCSSYLSTYSYLP
jgi:hypothetical protein